MTELLASVGVATLLLGWVVRDVLVDHAAVLRATSDDPDEHAPDRR